MTAPKPKAPEDAQGGPDVTPATEPAGTDEQPQTVTLSLDQLGELVAAKVAEAIAALPQAEVSKAAPAVPFQSVQFDKGSDQPRVVMTLGDPDTDGRVETKTVHDALITPTNFTGNTPVLMLDAHGDEVGG